MKKKVIVAVLSLTLFLMIFAAMPVMATEPTPVSGKWVGISSSITALEHKYVGANTITEVYNKGYYTTGTIMGDFEQTFTVINHYKDPEVVATLNADPRLRPEVQFNWADMDRVFQSATVLGHTGGLTMRLQATGFGNNLKGPAYFDLQGTWTIISGTGDLANLHGQGTWWHSRTGFSGLEYEGQVHFDP